MDPDAPALVPAEPAPEPDGAGGAGGVLSWLLENPFIPLAVIALVALGYGYSRLKRRYTMRTGKEFPPVGRYFMQTVKISYREDTRPVSKKFPALTWTRLAAAVTILTLAAVALRQPIPAILLGLITLMVVLHGTNILKIRQSVIQQMTDVAIGEMGAAAVQVTEWRNLVYPATTVVNHPAKYRCSDQQTQERFETNFTASTADRHGWIYNWEPHRNRVVCEPTPLLPAKVNYPPGPTTHPWDKIPIGVTADGETAAISLDAFPHLLVTGTTGSGKSVTQRAIMLHAMRSPHWRVLGVDLKRVELSAFKDKKHVLKIAVELEDALSVLRGAETEMHRRYKELEAAGAQKYKDFKPDAPALLVMVDELFALLAMEKVKDEEAKERDSMRAQCTAIISSIARLGRGASVHLVLATQRPDATILPGELKANLDARVAMGRMDMTPSLMVLDSDRATRTPKIAGRGVLRQGADLIEFQGFWIAPNDIDAILAQDDRQQHMPADMALDLAASSPGKSRRQPAGDGRMGSVAGRLGPLLEKVAAWWGKLSERAARNDAERESGEQGRPGQPGVSARTVEAPKVRTTTRRSNTENRVPSTPPLPPSQGELPLDGSDGPPPLAAGDPSPGPPGLPHGGRLPVAPGGSSPAVAPQPAPVEAMARPAPVPPHSPTPLAANPGNPAGGSELTEADRALADEVAARPLPPWMQA